MPMVLSAQSEAASEVSAAPLHVIPTGAALGAEVRGIDLRDIDAAQFAAIEQAWHDHQVLLVRGQTLSDQDLIAFSRRFGDLDWAPVQETGRRFVEGMPEIYIVSNVTVNGQPIGSRHVVSRGAADGEHALLAGSAPDRRQHLVLQHVRDL
jgi:taurine dioxygenase